MGLFSKQSRYKRSALQEARPRARPLAWLLTRPAVTSPIIGPRTIEQLTTSLGALEIKLDEATFRALDEIFPGHKPAPEDYAW